MAKAPPAKAKSAHVPKGAYAHTGNPDRRSGGDGRPDGARFDGHDSWVCGGER